MGRSKNYPSRPHLIVVPGTLISQWEHELKCFFKFKFVDLFLYPSGLPYHREFWKPGGIYESSAQPPCHRIIIATLSVSIRRGTCLFAHSPVCQALQQDFSTLYTKDRSPKSLPWDLPTPVGNFDALAPTTLFGREYLTCVIDEAQGVRNLGSKHSAALAILEKSIVRLVLTATPLQTSTKVSLHDLRCLQFG